MSFSAIPRVPALIETPERRDPETGRVLEPRKTWVNSAKNQVKPWFATLDTDPVTLAASATRSFALRALAEENLLGDFEVAQVLSEHTGRYTVQLYNAESDRSFMSQPVHVGCFAGTAQLPFQLFESFFIQAGGASRVELRNLETAEITIRQWYKGRRFLGYSGYRGYTKEEIIQRFASRRSHPYWLGTQTSPFTLTASASRTRQFFDLLTGEADLEVDSVLFVASGPFRVEFREGQSGRQITEGEIPSSLLGGPAILAAKLPDTWLVKRNTHLTGFFTDVSGAANTVYIYLHGRLLYDDEPGEQSVHTIPVPMVERKIATYGTRNPRR